MSKGQEYLKNAEKLNQQRGANLEELDAAISKKDMAELVAKQIVSDYHGLKIGGAEQQLMTEQLFFRIRRSLLAALDGEIETECEIYFDNVHGEVAAQEAYQDEISGW